MLSSIIAAIKLPAKELHPRQNQPLMREVSLLAWSEQLLATGPDTNQHADLLLTIPRGCAACSLISCNSTTDDLKKIQRLEENLAL